MQPTFQAPYLLLRPWVLILPQAMGVGQMLQEGFHQTPKLCRGTGRPWLCWQPWSFAQPGQAVVLLLPWAGMQGPDDQGIPIWFSFFAIPLGFSLAQHLCPATSWPK